MNKKLTLLIPLLSFSLFAPAQEIEPKEQADAASQEIDLKEQNALTRVSSLERLATEFVQTNKQFEKAKKDLPDIRAKLNTKMQQKRKELQESMTNLKMLLDRIKSYEELLPTYKDKAKLQTKISELIDRQTTLLREGLELYGEVGTAEEILEAGRS